MSVCEFPGCVAASPCPVHATAAYQRGKKCEACQGTGRVQRAGDSGRYRSDPCDRCAGVGLRDAKRSTLTPKSEREPVDDRDLIRKASE